MPRYVQRVLPPLLRLPFLHTYGLGQSGLTEQSHPRQFKFICDFCALVSSKLPAARSSITLLRSLALSTHPPPPQESVQSPQSVPLAEPAGKGEVRTEANAGLTWPGGLH